MRAAKFVLIIALTGAAALLSAAAEATPLVVANASFESPALADGTAISSSSVTFASQGGYGWVYDPNSSIINPDASEFTGAAGSGTPLGADGPQVTDVARVSGFGGIIQVLAGGDGIVGNSDDPLVSASTVYLLTVSVGHSLLRPNFGGYDLQLFARNGVQDTIIAQITDAGAAIVPGTFSDVGLFLDSSNLSPSVYGQALGIRLQPQSSSGTVQFDNVRLEAVPEPASWTLLFVGAWHCVRRQNAYAKMLRRFGSCAN